MKFKTMITTGYILIFLGGVIVVMGAITQIRAERRKDNLEKWLKTRHDMLIEKELLLDQQEQFQRMIDDNNHTPFTEKEADIIWYLNEGENFKDSAGNPKLWKNIIVGECKGKDSTENKH